MSYHRITPADRYRIEAGLQSGFSIREIAKKLKRSPSTICREILRNATTKTYGAEAAILQHERRQKRPKRKPKIRGDLEAQVTEKLMDDLSPEQISVWLRMRKQSVSKQTIYRFIEREKRKGNNLMSHLRILRKEGHD